MGGGRLLDTGTTTFARTLSWLLPITLFKAHSKNIQSLNLNLHHQSDLLVLVESYLKVYVLMVAVLFHRFMFLKLHRKIIVNLNQLPCVLPHSIQCADVEVLRMVTDFDIPLLVIFSLLCCINTILFVITLLSAM